MIVRKSCLNILIGILFYNSRVNGQLTMNLPASGIYLEATEMNCTDSSFDITNGYIWYKDNNIIYDNVNGDPTGKYTSSHGTGYFTLVINNTALDDNGLYRCSHNFQDATGTLEIEGKGNGKGKLNGGSLKITITGLYPSTATVLSVVGKGMTFPGTQTKTADNGNLSTIAWTSESATIDSDNVKAGCDVTIQSLTTYVIHVKIERPTTTTATITTTPTVPTVTNSTTSSTTTSNITSDHTGAIIGSCVGFFFLAFCIFVCYLLRRKNQIKKEGKYDHDRKSSDVVMKSVRSDKNT